MTFYVGATEAAAVKVGATDADALYVGADQVWSAMPTVDPYTTAVLADSPVAYWPLDAAPDGLGLVAVGTPTYITTGPNGGGAAHFTTTADYFQIPATYPAALRPTVAVSVEIWVRSTGQNRMFVSTPSSSGGPYGYNLGSFPDGARLETGQGGPTAIHSPSPVNDGTWHHIVATVTSGERKLYVDGSLANSDTRGGDLAYWTGDAWRIGNRDGEYGLVGDVAACAIYDHVLTTARVMEHYSASRVVPEASTYDATVLADGPGVYWPMSDGSGSPQDAAGSNHLTLSGGANAYAYDPQLGTVLNASVGRWSTTFRCPQSAYTMATWVRFKSAPSGDMTPISDWGGAGASGAMIVFSGDRAPRGYHGGAYLTAPAISDDAWHYIVSTWNGTTQRLYVDGAEASNRAEAGAPGNGNMSRISTYGYGEADREFSGYLARTAWFTTALSPGQISAHYAAGAP